VDLQKLPLFLQKCSGNEAEFLQKLGVRVKEGTIMTIKSQKYPNRLKETIKQAGYTIEGIAAETNIPARTLSDYCAGRVPIPKDRLGVLAYALGYPTEYLVPKILTPSPDDSFSAVAVKKIESDSITKDAQEIHERAGEQELSGTFLVTRPSNSTFIFPTQSEKPAEIVITDCATMFGFQHSQVTTLIQQWYGMAMFCNDLQNRLDQEVKKLDGLKSQYPLEEYAISRRCFLVSIAALPTALLHSVQQEHKMTLELEEFLPQCAASIVACWYLSGGSHLEVIEPILDSYLRPLLLILKHAPTYHHIAATLVAQIYSLKVILAWHLKSLNDAEAYCIQALNYSMIAKNANLQLTALNQHALISFYAKNFQQALAKSEEADDTLRRVIQEEHIFPIVQGRVYMYLAALQAQQGFQTDAGRTLENVHRAFASQSASAEPVPMYADCGNMSLTLWDGLTHYYLGRYDATCTQKALNSLSVFGQLQPNDIIPERFRLECLNNRILAAVQRDEMEEAIVYFEAGKQGARGLNSKQRSAEINYAYQEILNKWPKEARIQVLRDFSDNKERL